MALHVAAHSHQGLPTSPWIGAFVLEWLQSVRHGNSQQVCSVRFASHRSFWFAEQQIFLCQ